MIRRRAASATVSAIAALLAAALAVAGCGSSGSAPGASASGKPDVVVTYAVLGAVVREVVGTKAEVTVLMPNGADPHEWSPSARDVEKLRSADLVVDNGLGLEGNLQDPLRDAAAKGAKIFTVADHVTVRKVKAGEGSEADDPDQAPGADDPHLWMDALTMKQWVTPLAEALRGIGVDVTAEAAAAQAGLDTLQAEVVALVAKVPDAKRQLVTGHESMGYFAERYGFRLVGAVVPSVTSQGETSAGELADLTAKIKAAGVGVIFAEIGTPKATVQAIASDSGARVVELSTHTLPADGSYRTFLLGIASTVTTALA